MQKPFNAGQILCIYQSFGVFGGFAVCSFPSFHKIIQDDQK